MKKIIYIFLMVVLSGCSLYTVNSEDTTENFYPAKESASDVIYIETVDRPHEVIGIVNVTAERRQDIESVVEKMKREAAILGADAITDIKTDATGTWKKLPAQKFIGNGYIRANFSASAVVFK